MARRRSRFLSGWRILERIAKYAIVPLGVGAFYASKRSVELPPVGRIHESLSEAPVQTITKTPPFRFEWRGAVFVVTPRADYSLRGLVVTHNNISGLADMYHTSDSVDLKDLCVVWGSTATEGLYRFSTFWSEPWTCQYRYADRDRAIDPEELSNNHLLAGTEEIARRIRDTKIGDQIEMEGFLVDYAPLGDPDLVRRTSLVRNDTGNGACEVLFVTRFETLSRANEKWRSAAEVLWKSSLGSLIVILLSFTLLPYLEYRIE